MYLRDEHGVPRPVRLTRRAHVLIAGMGMALVVGQATLVLGAVGLLSGAPSAHAAVLAGGADAAGTAPAGTAGTAAGGSAAVVARAGTARAGAADRASRSGRPADVADPSPWPVAVPDDGSARPTVAWPVLGAPITAQFGEQGSRWSHRHTGLDFNGWTGDSVFAATDGAVVAVLDHPAYGTLLKIRRDDGVETWYAHLSEVLRDKGSVHAGERIALMGSTGNSTGSHLHFEVRVNGIPTDPAAFLWGPQAGQPAPPPRWVCAVYPGC